MALKGSRKLRVDHAAVERMRRGGCEYGVVKTGKRRGKCLKHPRRK